ncbi:YfdQ family protein [Actinobacillus equuli subsp. equuli]|nr:DUF2303 family protein [Actinobacillus equuli]WGE55853.1 YfdQ family protein [Actinobacillus equuli subsp. equuli]
MFEETRKSEFKSVQRLQDGTMTFAFTDEKSGGGTTRLPEEIVLGLQPFHNSEHYQIKARINYRIKNGLLTLWYELINLDVDFYEGNLVYQAVLFFYGISLKVSNQQAEEHTWPQQIAKKMMLFKLARYSSYARLWALCP